MVNLYVSHLLYINCISCYSLLYLILCISSLYIYPYFISYLTLLYLMVILYVSLIFISCISSLSLLYLIFNSFYLIYISFLSLLYLIFISCISSLSLLYLIFISSLSYLKFQMIQVLFVERVAEWLRHWTWDQGDWGSIPAVLVICESLGQALNPHCLWPLSSNEIQFEWKSVLCGWLQLQKKSCILPIEMRLKEWVPIPGGN